PVVQHRRTANPTVFAPPAVLGRGGLLDQAEDLFQGFTRFRDGNSRQKSWKNLSQSGHLKPAKQVGSQDRAGFRILEEVQKPEEGIGSDPEGIPSGRTAQNVEPYVGEGLVDPGPQGNREPF